MGDMSTMHCFKFNSDKYSRVFIAVLGRGAYINRKNYVYIYSKFIVFILSCCVINVLIEVDSDAHLRAVLWYKGLPIVFEHSDSQIQIFQ